MTLPIRTTLEDLNTVCGYLSSKPTGATLAEAKAVVDKKHLDGRKLSAMKYWEMIEEEEDRLKVTEQGRQLVRDAGAYHSNVLKQLVKRIGPYLAIVERAVHRGENSISASEVAAHWHAHFKSQASTKDATLNAQAVCFFQIAQRADLGELIIGRRGMPTRFDFDDEAIRSFVGAPSTSKAQISTVLEPQDRIATPDTSTQKNSSTVVPTTESNRVFITHGKNRKILEQVKELVTFGKFEPVVALEQETPAKPIPKKVMDDMRTCRAAVIHVDAEHVFQDENRNEIRLCNENVLIEIGAAMALYEERFVLLVEEGLQLPTNLQGLYECRYIGNELNMQAIMKLLKALNKF